MMESKTGLWEKGGFLLTPIVTIFRRDGFPSPAGRGHFRHCDEVFFEEEPLPCWRLLRANALAIRDDSGGLWVKYHEA